MTDIPTGPQPSLGKEVGVALVPHPDFPHHAIAIVVDVARTSEGDFVLRYAATGDTNGIKVPAPVRYASRGIDLWRTTCFEAFVALEGKHEYLEFNFSPSTAWEVYRLSSYREKGDILPFPAPNFDVEISDGRIEVTVALDTTEMPPMISAAPWQLGLSAIIEAKDGSKSYWALAHAPGPPDFHNRDCFTARLAAPTRP